MRCSTYLRTSCKRKLWNVRVNPNVQRGLLRVMVNAKNIKRGQLNTKMKEELSDEGKKKISISENVTPSAEKDVNAREHKYCLRCGRRLKNYDNRVLGYGPICYAKIQQEKVFKKLF